MGRFFCFRFSSKSAKIQSNLFILKTMLLAKIKKHILSFIAGISLGLISLSLAIFIMGQTSLNKIEFHEHANFLLMIDGVAQDFSKPEYMSIKPCITSNFSFKSSIASLIPSVNAHGGHEDKILTDIVHLHSNVGTTIHAHEEGVTYSEFFRSIGMSLTDTSFTNEKGTKYENSQEKSFRFFLNNQEIPSIKDQAIRNLDQVLITYGNRDRTEAEINAELIQVPNDACKESGNCPHRGIVPPEDCGNADSRPWLFKLLDIQAHA